MKQVQVSKPVDATDRTGASGWNESLTVQCDEGEVANVVHLVVERCEIVQIVVTDSPEGATVSDSSAWYDWEG